MKQIKITISSPFYNVEKIFDANNVKAQIKFMNEYKKSWAKPNVTGEDKPKLHCKIETIESTKPDAIIMPAKPVQHIAPKIIEIKPKPQNLPAIAQPLHLVIDGIYFEFRAKQNKFVSVADKYTSISLNEVKGLHELNLLRVPKQYQQAFNYFVN